MKQIVKVMILSLWIYGGRTLDDDKIIQEADRLMSLFLPFQSACNKENLDRTIYSLLLKLSNEAKKQIVD